MKIKCSPKELADFILAVHNHPSDPFEMKVKINPDALYEAFRDMNAKYGKPRTDSTK